MTWTSSEDIGIALFENFPDVDPLTVRFTDLRERVIALDGFDDDPKASNEPKLEAIQMAWYEEWNDSQRRSTALTWAASTVAWVCNACEKLGRASPPSRIARIIPA